MSERIEIWIEGHDGLSKVTKSASKQLGVLQGHTKATSKGMHQMAEHVDHAAHKMQGMDLMMKGMSMSMLALPFLMVGGAALKSAAKFEQTANVLQVATEATNTQREALQKLALQLGQDTVFSAGEAIQGMLELGKAGLNVTQITAAMPGVLDLAAAGELTIAEAAETAATSVNAFGLNASRATDVANMLAAAANASSIEVKDLRDSLQMSSAVAAKAGIPIEAVTTALALLGNAGIQGSDAGTSFKQMLLALQNPSKEAKAILGALGVTIYDAQGRMRDLRDIITQFTAATSKLTQKSRDQALATIFGSDAVRAANVLLTEGTEKYDDMTKAVNKSGAAQALAEARMKGLAGAVEYLKGSVDSFLIGQGLPFTDTVGGWVRGLADLITNFGRLPAPVLQGVAAMVGLTGAMLATGGVIAGVLASLTMIGGPILALSAAVVALGIAWTLNWGGIRDRTTEAVNQAIPQMQRLASFLDQNLGTILQVSAVAIGGWATFTVGRFVWVGAEAVAMGVKVSTAFLTTMATAIATAVPTMLVALAPFVPTLLLIGGAAAILATIWTQNWGNIQEKTAAIVKFVVEDTDKVFEAILKLMPMAGLLRDAWARDLKDLMDIYKKTAEYIRDRTEDMRRWNEERLGIQQSTTPGSRESVMGGKFRGREPAISAHDLIPEPPKLAAAAHESGKASAGNFITAFIDQFKAGFPEVQKIIKGFFSDATKAFTDSDALAKLKEAEEMMRGFLNAGAAATGGGKPSIPPGLDIDWDGLLKKAKALGVSVQDLKNALIALHPATLAAAVAVGYWESQIEAVNLALIANRDQIRAAQAEYDRLGESLRAAQAEYSRMADNLGVLNQKLSDAKARLADLAAPKLTGMGELDKQMSAIERQMKRLQLAELDLPSLEELRNQMTKKVRIYAADGSKYIEMTQEGTGAEEKLAEMRKAAMDKVLKQFPEMTEEMKNYLATLPLTKEGLQKALEQLQLTKDLKFDEALQKIKEAAEGVKEEMTFEEAMKQIADTKAEIAGLTGAITTQEAAMQAQQAIIDSINVSMENQRAVIAEIQRAGDALNATLAAFQAELEGAKVKQDLINTALGLAYKWFLDDKDAVTAMGTEGERVAGVMDVKTTALLAAIEKAATDTTGTATTALGTMVTAYQADMAKAIVEVIGKNGKGGLVGTLEKIKPPIDDAVLSTNALKNAIDALQDKTITITTVHKSVGQGGGDSSSSTTEAEQRASGGPVYSGRAYLIGEAGPEIFRPNVGGSIIPNSRSAGGNTYVYVTVQGTVTAERDLAETVRRELIRVKSRNVTSGL